MGDMGDFYKDFNKHKRERKEIKNLKGRAIEILGRNGIEYTVLSEYHFRIGDFDLWPTTWKWVNRATKQKGHGVDKLVKLIKAVK